MTKTTDEAVTEEEHALICAERRVAEQIASVDGHLTKADVDDLADLRLRCGKSWDAVNERWQPLEQREQLKVRQADSRKRRSHYGNRREAACGVGEMDCE